ncbi:hypothetical protein TLA_TLA_00630 [Tessaracoccus lapidicaptus]|nr:hypothetical protein TLA_TLA_00630 [Tessaracoccus lapidicaptus]
MRERFLRLVAAMSIALVGGWLGAPSAEARVTDGACATSTGVTVAVDYQALGGGTVVRCVEDVEPGTSGLQVLHDAGFAPQGTVTDGPTFVCRIGGRPAADEGLAVEGEEGYRESCVETPPATAFWSYWYAPNGGSWTFSNYGASAREVIVGGYEGWSFALNTSQSTAPRPRVLPSHAVEPTISPTPTRTSAPPTATAAPASSSRPASSSAPATAATTRATRTPSPRATAESSAPPVVSTPPALSSAAPSVAPSTPAPKASPASTTPQPPASSAAAPSASTLVASRAPAPPVEATPPGIPAGTLVGVGAVAALGVGGGIAWWRRRGL